MDLALKMSIFSKVINLLRYDLMHANNAIGFVMLSIQILEKNTHLNLLNKRKVHFYLVFSNSIVSVTV